MSHLIQKIATSIVFVSGLAFAGHALADARSDAQAQAAAAAAHVKKVGVDQATKDINTAPEWKAKSMNVNLINYKGLVLASSLNERLVGKETLEMRDPSGKEFVKEFVATAQKGEGWVTYQFINPESKKLEERTQYIRGIPGVDAFVGVAVSK